MIKKKYKKNINIHPDFSFKIDRSLIGKKFKKKFKIKINPWAKQIDQMFKNYKLTKKLYNYL